MGEGGGGSYGRYEHESRHILYTWHIVTASSTDRIVHENNPYGIQIREHCSLNNQGQITQKVCKHELSLLYATHCHDLFYITVKCHDDNIYKRVFKVQSGHGIASETIKGK